MSDGRTVKKVFLGKPDERRKPGRPKLRWLDCTDNDLKSNVVKRRRKKTDRRPFCTGYHSEGGTAETVRNACQ
jgi:hypothetical protein